MDTGAWLATESDMTEHTGLTTLLVCSQDTVAWRKCGRGQRVMGEVLASLTHMIPCRQSSPTSFLISGIQALVLAA